MSDDERNSIDGADEARGRRPAFVEETDAPDDEEAELAAYLEMKGRVRKTEFKFDKAALAQRLEEIKLRINDAEPAWLETLVMTSPQPIATEIPNADDDLNRETVFYQHARASAILGLQRFIDNNIPYRRPDDYFAEMVKSDQHMFKIKAALVSEKEAIEGAEERRRIRDAKKFGKKVQAKRLAEKAAARKAEMGSVERMRKQQSANNVDSARALASSRKRSMLEESDGAPARKRAKMPRNVRDKKYGFGGPKRFMKRNDGKSVNDLSDWSSKRNMSGANTPKGKSGGGFKGKGGGGGFKGKTGGGGFKGKAGGSHRPGKARRAQGRGRN